ncbi:MAG: amidase [Polyangiaceae bacterium]|nr:amidase [Polyangiaceae bacterium]
MTIPRLSATELRAALDRRELSAREIVDALIERRHAVDGKLGAWVETLDAEARAAAERADERLAAGERGPLLGLPLSIKENLEVRGTRVTLGFLSRRDERVERDAVVVSVARDAGAVILGKTNVPQSLLSAETTNYVYGTTNNPWALERAPGGSSGGESAAIASGSSALGIGTDIGGSLRIPASFTGVAALKATEHRWSNIGSRAVIAGQETIRSQVGPIARTARDVALLFRGLPPASHANYDPFVPPLPVPDPATVELDKLRVGFYEGNGVLTPAESVRRAVREAAEHLSRAGAELVEVEPRNVRRVTWLFYAVASADGGKLIREAARGEEVIVPLRKLHQIARLPNAARRTLVALLRGLGEGRTADMLDAVGEKSVETLWALTRERAELRRVELQDWTEQRLDLVLCPAFATAAPQHGASADFTLGAQYSMRYNVLNFPAGVVPVTRVRDHETERSELRDRLDRSARDIQRGSVGLPVGVQIVGRPFHEHQVLAAMIAVEDGARASAEFPHTPVEPG